MTCPTAETHVWRGKQFNRHQRDLNDMAVKSTLNNREFHLFTPKYTDIFFQAMRFFLSILGALSGQREVSIIGASKFKFLFAATGTEDRGFEKLPVFSAAKYLRTMQVFLCLEQITFFTLE